MLITVHFTWYSFMGSLAFIYEKRLNNIQCRFMNQELSVMCTHWSRAKLYASPVKSSSVTVFKLLVLIQCPLSCWENSISLFCSKSNKWLMDFPFRNFHVSPRKCNKVTCSHSNSTTGESSVGVAMLADTVHVSACFFY